MVEKQFKSLQELIDRCTKHDYNAVKEAFSMKKVYLNTDQRADYIRKEIFRITEELVSISQKVPALKSIAFDWHTPNFVWETSFYEYLTIAERRKYIAFPYDSFDDKQYIENPASYDESLPYFSDIIELLVYSQYLEDLQKTETKLLPQPETKETTIDSQEEVSSKKVVGKENPFNCTLNKSEIRLLADCVNEAHIFTTEITPQILEDFFYCQLTGALKSTNNRLLAYFMMKLSAHEYITYEWQSVVANNNLVLAPMKEKYLNASDLSTANDNIKYISPKKSEVIDKFIKQLKKG
ncbi:hypothetical protein [Parabacteroides sp. PF5-9]|uniref:hypothetical protein n=1 Tax=Parabacteroides sp. PF5-9 TaxID=1742404 RepID=UPI002474F6E5|nr:hypothetical protein [Parabacteroides sp. PF5-9]MDH6356358.1 hypothetical protein [Parabacteroides sp. PF5-9]